MRSNLKKKKTQDKGQNEILETQSMLETSMQPEV